MIDRITTSVDLYSHLRLEVALAERGRSQQRGRTTSAGDAADARGAVIIDLDSEANRRSARAGSSDYSKLIRFEQSALAGDSESGYEATADEVLPALEASVLPRDWRMARAATLYTNAGRIGAGAYSATVGTRLNAMA